MSCGAETEANLLLPSLLAGEDVSLPSIDYSKLDLPDGFFDPFKLVVSRLEVEDLTTGTVDGTGVFDVLMRANKAHLQNEYEKNRITGAEYTKAYIAMIESAMASGTQFLLGRDQAYWAAIAGQLGAIQAHTALEIAKMQLANAKFEALTSKATFGLAKMKLASESMAYCSAKFQLDNLLPQQLATGEYQLTQMLPQQLQMVKEQTEAQRAQTSNTRTDGSPVVGLLGKQKELYSQQITSYMRDSEMKAAKLFTDAWITMKTIDEGLEPPINFANASLNEILADIKTNNNIG